MTKKILQINITCGIGSTGKLSLALYDACLDSGYEGRFAYSALSPALPSAFRIENKFQNALRRGLNRFFGKRIRNSTPGTKRLIRYIKREKPDLIHLHNIQQNSVDYPRLLGFLKKTGIPVVFTLHDCWSFTGGCYHFTENECADYVNGCNNCATPRAFDDKKRSASDSLAIKKELIGDNSKIQVICVSDWLLHSAEKSYMGSMKLAPARIYNGIDCNVFHTVSTDIREKLGCGERFILLGVAGYWTEKKGLDIFKKIAELLPECIIILVGNVDASEKFPDNMIITGTAKNREELISYYSAADAYLNASKEETFGMTTAEAMACGTPAIVFDSTACPEVVDEKSGIILQDFSAAAVVSAINTIRENGKAFFSYDCAEKIKREFSLEAMKENYLDVYRRMLGND